MHGPYRARQVPPLQGRVEALCAASQPQGRATGLYRSGIEATLFLPAEAASVAKARAFVRALLRQWNAAGFEEPAVLLVSELVTNAVLHSATPSTVEVRLNTGILWIGIADGSAVIPAPKRYGVEAATGRGLQLVERIASRWGVSRSDSGKVVWFELSDESAQEFAAASSAALLEDFAELGLEVEGRR